MKRWSKQEDETLISYISKNPQNLTEAFKIASNKLGRTSRACEFRWYGKLSKNPNTSTCFITIGKKTINKNRKVVSVNTRDNTTQNKLSKWRRILNILFE